MPLTCRIRLSSSSRRIFALRALISACSAVVVPGRVPGINLGVHDPTTHRFWAQAELLGHCLRGRPHRRIVVPMLQDHPHRPSLHLGADLLGHAPSSRTHKEAASNPGRFNLPSTARACRASPENPVIAVIASRPRQGTDIRATLAACAAERSWPIRHHEPVTSPNQASPEAVTSCRLMLIRFGTRPRRRPASRSPCPRGAPCRRP